MPLLPQIIAYNIYHHSHHSNIETQCETYTRICAWENNELSKPNSQWKMGKHLAAFLLFDQVRQFSNQKAIFCHLYPRILGTARVWHPVVVLTQRQRPLVCPFQFLCLSEVQWRRTDAGTFDWKINSLTCKLKYVCYNIIYCSA